MENEKIVSNLEFVKDHVNNIQEKSAKYIEFCSEKHGMDSSAKENNMLYSRMNGIMSKFCNMQIELMEKLNKEGNFIVKAAETYDELDKHLEDKAGDLK